MTTAIKTYARANKTLFITLLLVLSLGVANAFDPAPGNPPNCTDLTRPGCNEPINTGATGQTKSGSLGLDRSSFTNSAKASLELGGNSVGGATKGFLPPRMADPSTITSGLTGAEKTSLNGLTVYNTTSNQLERFDGTAWGPAVGGASTGGVEGPMFSATYTSASLTLSGTGAWQYVHIPFNNIVSPSSKHNTDPCVAGGPACGTPTSPATAWGFSPNGYFAPSVPGKYLLTAYAYSAVNASAYTGLAIYKNGSQLVAPTYQTHASAHNSADQITAVVDAAKGDIFSIRFAYYHNSGVNGTFYGGGYATFSGSRVGNPVNVQPIQTQFANVPPQAVMFFASKDLSTSDGCPAGWTEFTQLRGKYSVGLPLNGTLLGGAGLAMSDQETRNIPGNHTHTVNIAHTHNTNIDHYHYLVDPAHTHQQSGWFSANNSRSGYYTPSTEAYSGLGYYNNYTNTAGGSGFLTSYMSANQGDYIRGSSGPSVADFTTAGASPSSGVTNAPYVQLLACKKI